MEKLRAIPTKKLHYVRYVHRSQSWSQLSYLPVTYHYTFILYTLLLDLLTTSSSSWPTLTVTRICIWRAFTSELLTMKMLHRSSNRFYIINYLSWRYFRWTWTLLPSSSTSVPSCKERRSQRRWTSNVMASELRNKLVSWLTTLKSRLVDLYS